MKFVQKYSIPYPDWHPKANRISLIPDPYEKMHPHLMNENFPIVGVSWDSALTFCKILSAMEGNNYNLPSEAEWEYACRAGTTRKRYGQLDEIAWWGGNSNGRPHLVGLKKPNKWGIYDMLGNVGEYCLDHYYRNYDNAPNDGEAWIDQSHKKKKRVVRASSFNLIKSLITAYQRGRILPTKEGYRGIGFRIVMRKKKSIMEKKIVR